MKPEAKIMRERYQRSGRRWEWLYSVEFPDGTGATIGYRISEAQAYCKRRGYKPVPGWKVLTDADMDRILGCGA